MANIEQEIQKKVISITRQNQERLAEEDGIETSITEDEMKAYLDEVIREVKKDVSRNKTGSDQ